MKETSCNSSRRAVEMDSLWAAATHWSHRISLFMSKVAPDQRDPEESTSQARRNLQAHQLVKSHGQVRRGKQAQRYDVASIVPSTQQSEAAAVHGSSDRPRLYTASRHQNIGVEGGSTHQAHASRQQLLQRLHAKIDSLKRSGSRRNSPAEMPKPKSAAKQNRNTAFPKDINLKTQKQLPRPQELNESEVSRKCGDDESFSFGDLKTCDEKPNSLCHGKRGDKKRRIDRALR